MWAGLYAADAPWVQTAWPGVTLQFKGSSMEVSVLGGFPDIFELKSRSERRVYYPEVSEVEKKPVLSIVRSLSYATL